MGVREGGIVHNLRDQRIALLYPIPSYPIRLSVWLSGETTAAAVTFIPARPG